MINDVKLQRPASAQHPTKRAATLDRVATRAILNADEQSSKQPPYELGECEAISVRDSDCALLIY